MTTSTTPHSREQTTMPTLKMHPPRRGWMPILAMLVAIAIATISALALISTPTAKAETPAERCARETAAYNSAWAQSWAASNGKPADQAPPPPVPYTCVDPGPPTSSTAPPPSVTAPTIPTETNTPDTGGPNMGAHAPTDIPEGGQTPIVPIPPRVVPGFPRLPRVTPPSFVVPRAGSPYDPRHLAAHDSKEVLETLKDACGNTVVVRRGYWSGDPASSGGYGRDKAEWKHNIEAYDSVIYDTIRGQCGREVEPGKLQYDRTIEQQTCWPVPGGFSCSPNGVTVNVRVIVITGRDVDGKPVTKAEDQMGLLTAYCVGYDPECPDWINNSDFGVLGGTDDPSGGWA